MRTCSGPALRWTHWQPAGHRLMPTGFAVAKTWLQSVK